MPATKTAAADISLRTIRNLREDALEAGDESTADDCLTVLAYNGTVGTPDEADKDAARGRIAKVIDNARAMEST